MNKIIKNHIKQQIIFHLRSPAFHLLSVIVPIITSINFYIRFQFFSSTGSTDTVLFFSAIPYILSIVIPILCYKNKNFCYEDFVPLSKLQSIISYFLAVFFLYLIIIFFTTLCIFPVAFFGNLDFGKVLISFIFLLLFGSAIISLCILLNELFNSKISALLVSILIIFVINFAHLICVYVPLPDSISSLIKVLSFAWHYDAAGKAIIDTRDFFWLSGSCVLFIFITLFIKELKAENKQKIFLSLNLGIITFICLFLLNTGRYYKRFDCSKNQTYSLSKYSKNLIKETHSQVKITYYRSSALNRLYPQIRDISDFLKTYADQNKNISLIIKDPDKDSSLANLLENYGITSQQMRTVKNNSTEYINVYSAIVLESEGNYQTIPFSLNADSLEYDLDICLKNLIYNQQRIVNLIIGNGMNYYEDYSYLVPWLTSQGFICNPIFTNDKNFSSILQNSQGLLLVIGDSQINIEQAVSIENYILSGKGNALFFVSPYSSDIEGDWSISANKHTNLVEMLENWGIYFEPKIAADISCSVITMYSQENNDDLFSQNSTHTEVLNYPLWINLLPQENSKLGATLFWSTPLTITGENSEPLLISTPQSFNLAIENHNLQKIVETNPFILNTMNFNDKEKSTQILGAKISGNLTGLYNILSSKNTEIFVIPDQYFLSTTMTGYNSMYTEDLRNFYLTANLLLKLNHEYELAELQSKTTYDTSLYKIQDINRFIKFQLITYVLCMILIPLVSILFNVLLLFLLKNKWSLNYEK